MKINKIVLTTFLILGAAMAHALELKPYTAAALSEAQKTNQPVALHFHADWCPTCRAQTKVMQGLTSDPALNLTVLVVNYDTEKALKQRFKVNMQSTLIVLKGQKEVDRLVGDTSLEGIRSALKMALIGDH